MDLEDRFAFRNRTTEVHRRHIYADWDLVRNANALGGTISSEIFQDASALEYSSAQQQGVWREWSLLSSEGDIVALSHLASEGKVSTS